MTDIDAVLEHAKMKSPTSTGGAYIFSKDGWRPRAIGNVGKRVSAFVCDILMEKERESEFTNTTLTTTLRPLAAARAVRLGSRAGG